MAALTFILFCATIGILFGSWLVQYRSNRRLFRRLDDLILNAQVQDRVIAALVARLTPHGHVDLRAEEIEEVKTLRIFENRDGTVRILAK